MAKVWLGPTGTISKGHVLDCSRAPLEEALRLYDPQLYIKWNSKKLQGWGVWEVRRKPEAKSIRPSKCLMHHSGAKTYVQGDIYDFDGYCVIYPKYHENDLVHHVLDVAYLNYDILTKLKKMDQWELANGGKDFAKNLEYEENKQQTQIREKLNKELQYNLKQIKSAVNGVKEHILSGGSPADIARHWGK